VQKDAVPLLLSNMDGKVTWPKQTDTQDHVRWRKPTTEVRSLERSSSGLSRYVGSILVWLERLSILSQVPKGSGFAQRSA
jgi:hypothetical protein